MRPDAPVVLDVRDLQVYFALRGGFLQRLTGRTSGAVKAVDGVSLQVREGEVLGVVGESGSGKTTLGRALLGLVEATGGSVRYRGQELVGLPESRFRVLRRKLQMVFQDPHASLSPSMDLLTAVGHPLKIHKLARGSEVETRVRAALERVGLAPVERFLGKFPADLSGGQKQRAVIARAIILGPELLVADEPVSMLDMSVRAKILELMLDLKRDLGLTYVYITHDLATAKFFCDTLAIMYLGRIVEYGPAEQIYAAPKHPYTRSLLRAVPEPDPSKSVPVDLPRGEVPDAVNPPQGCSFHPRGPDAFEVCGWEGRDLRAMLEQRWVALSTQGYEHERAVLGDLDGAVVEPARVLLPPAAGHSAQEVLELLERIRSEDPDEQFWRGVSDLREGDGGVEIRFREDWTDPGRYDVGRQQVACLLYDQAACARAGRDAARR